MGEVEQKALILAEKWYGMRPYGSDEKAVASLAILLIQVQMESRLDEARWWNARHHDPTTSAAESRHERIGNLEAKARA